jgi:hypothetical protein
MLRVRRISHTFKESIAPLRATGADYIRGGGGGGGKKTYNHKFAEIDEVVSLSGRVLPTNDPQAIDRTDKRCGVPQIIRII